ncbi:MAG TPA: hypothetical protein VEP90_30540 [Methylomirabilota bacterium]|nr:hypothetical protein [Methylomirabilota bacterium]
MENFIVEIWMGGRARQHDPDFIFNNIVANSPEQALRKVLMDNNITERVYAEVIWTESLNRQKFENYELRI